MAEFNEFEFLSSGTKVAPVDANGNDINQNSNCDRDWETNVKCFLIKEKYFLHLIVLQIFLVVLFAILPPSQAFPFPFYVFLFQNEYPHLFFGNMFLVQV